MGLLDLLGGGRRGGMSPMTMALLGLLAYRTMKGKGRLADMLGTGGGAGGALGGLLTGGAAGGLLSGGLKDLIDQFQQNGQGKKAQSWVSSGPNEDASPQDIEKALGNERIEWLMEQTGMSRSELLGGLSRELPEAVNNMTPDGRLPSEEEAKRFAA